MKYTLYFDRPSFQYMIGTKRPDSYEKNFLSSHNTVKELKEALHAHIDKTESRFIGRFDKIFEKQYHEPRLLELEEQEKK